MVELIAPGGGVFLASDEAAPLLMANGWTRQRAAAAKGDQDLTALTVAQLRARCSELGVDAPRKATKAQLVALLGA